MSDKPIVLANGTLKDPETGRFLPGSRPTSVIASSEQARSMVRRKQELGAIAARKALAEKAAENGLQRSPAAAVGLAAGTLYEAAMTVAPEGKVREAVEGFRMALRLGDMLPADDKQAAGARISIDLAPDVVSEIVEVMARRRGE